MVREKYGGVNNWKVPKHSEFEALFELCDHVFGGQSEKFFYWGLKDTDKNIDNFSFNNTNNNHVIKTTLSSIAG